LFWWQSFALLALILFLWSRLPMAAVFFEPRAVPLLPAPHAAYVVLDAKFATAAFKKSLTTWMSGGASERLALGMESAAIDFLDAPKAPEFLAQGKLYPGVWSPSAIVPLSDWLPDLAAPSSAETVSSLKNKVQPQGVRIELNPVLKEVAFSFPTSAETLTERAGHCRFYVETEKNGAVAHILLLSARTPGAAFFERMLFRGHASGAAGGMVDIMWSFPKL